MVSVARLEVVFSKSNVCSGGVIVAPGTCIAYLTSMHHVIVCPQPLQKFPTDTVAAQLQKEPIVGNAVKRLCQIQIHNIQLQALIHSHVNPVIRRQQLGDCRATLKKPMLSVIEERTKKLLKMLKYAPFKNFGYSAQ